MPPAAADRRSLPRGRREELRNDHRRSKGTTSQDRVRGFVERCSRKASGGATSRRSRANRPTTAPSARRQTVFAKKASGGRAVRHQRHHGDGRGGRAPLSARDADPRGCHGCRFRRHRRGAARPLPVDHRPPAAGEDDRGDVVDAAPRRPGPRPIERACGRSACAGTPSWRDTVPAACYWFYYREGGRPRPPFPRCRAAAWQLRARRPPQLRESLILPSSVSRRGRELRRAEGVCSPAAALIFWSECGQGEAMKPRMRMLNQG